MRKNAAPAGRIRTLLRWAVALCATGLLQAAGAASAVMIWPVDPSIEEDQRATPLWLENRGSEPVSLQIRIFGWSQDGKAEHYENQERVIASPPLAVIPPGQRQLVRLMNTGRSAEGKEEPYRVLIDELPDDGSATPSGNANGSAIGVKLQIRYSIPLFLYGRGIWAKARADRSRDPATAAQPQLKWRTLQEGDTHYLAVRNEGQAHARLTAVGWLGEGAPQPVTINPGLLGYVLAGSEMRWPLQAPPPAGHALQARVNGAPAPQKLAPH